MSKIIAMVPDECLTTWTTVSSFAKSWLFTEWFVHCAVRTRQCWLLNRSLGSYIPRRWTLWWILNCIRQETTLPVRPFMKQRRWRSITELPVYRICPILGWSHRRRL